MQTKLESFSEQSFDKSIYALLNASARFEKDDLNNKQFATAGGRRHLTAQFVVGVESFQYPDSVGILSKLDAPLSYFQLSGGFEKYFKQRGHFIFGLKGEAVFNNKRALDNYTSSIIQAPAFAPTLHSKTSFNEAYRSNQFLAVGILPIWNVSPSLFLRTELYGFFPLTVYQRSADQRAIPVRSWSNLQYIAETSLVYNLPFTSLSLFVNNYSYPKGNWNIGINLGYLLFGRRFME
jgi:NTE family protein